MVVFFHYTMGRSQADYGFKLGTTGVDLFFIISGFVIFMSLSKIENGRQFVINRLSRLFPTYWAIVTFSYLLFNFFNEYRFTDIGFNEYLANLTMFQFYFGVSDIDGPYWTMILEMLFYIVMLIFFGLKIMKRLHLFGILFTISIALMVFFQEDNAWIHSFFLYFQLAQFFPLFFTGILFYHLYTENKKCIKTHLSIALCLLVQVYIFYNAGRSAGYISQYEYALMLSCYFGLFFLFIHGKLKFMIHPVTLFLGEISFALYLIHQMISIHFIIPTLMNDYGFNFWTASLLVALPTVIILAYLVTRFVEKPLGKFMKRKLTLFLLGNKRTSTFYSIRFSMVIFVLFLGVYLYNSHFKPYKFVEKRWEVRSASEFNKRKTDAIFYSSLSLEDSLISKEWENINLIKDSNSLTNIITYTDPNEIYGLTYKSQELTELTEDFTTLFFHSKLLKQSNEEFLIVISIREQNDFLLTYEFTSLSKLLSNENNWEDVYLSIDLPKVVNDEYEFVLFVENSKGARIMMDDTEFLLVSSKTPTL